MHVQNVRTTRDEKRWEVEIRGEITVEGLLEHRTHTLKDLGRTANIPGFRKGHIPETALIKHFGEDAILAETAEHAVTHELPELLAKEQVNIVEAPRVTVETPKRDAPLVFLARAPLAPEVKLPDYKSLAAQSNKNKNPVEVSDKEHQETLTHLRRERARVEKIEAGAKPDVAAEEAHKADEKDLPQLDDEFVKTLGYENATAFGDKVREQITHEKTLQANSAHRVQLLEELVKESRISYPVILKEYELDDMEGRFASDLERMGKTLDLYLLETKKTREDVRKEWEETADKRAKIRLVLSEIARRENVEPDEETVSREVTRAAKQLPNSNQTALRAHIVHALRNEKVLEWLESQK